MPAPTHRAAPRSTARFLPAGARESISAPPIQFPAQPLRQGIRAKGFPLEADARCALFPHPWLREGPFRAFALRTAPAANSRRSHKSLAAPIPPRQRAKAAQAVPVLRRRPEAKLPSSAVIGWRILSPRREAARQSVPLRFAPAPPSCLDATCRPFSKSQRREGVSRGHPEKE